MQINLRDVVELVGVAAIVASLVFVGLQMQQTQQIALTQNLIASYETKAEIASEMNTHAALWVKANSGKALTEEEEFILENLVMARVDNGFFNWLQSQYLYGGDAGVVNAYETAAFLHRYPAARAKWIDNGTEHEEDVRKHLPSGSLRMGEKWVQLILDHLETLDRTK